MLYIFNFIFNVQWYKNQNSRSSQSSIINQSAQFFTNYKTDVYGQEDFWGYCSIM